MIENVKAKGKFEVFDEDGKLLYQKDNLVVATGLGLIANRMIGNSPAGITYCAVGDNDTIATSTDTTLYNELNRKAVTTSVAVNNVATVDTVFETYEANFTWKEVGLFNASSSGTMYNRTNISFIKNSQKVTARFTLTFTI